MGQVDRPAQVVAEWSEVGGWTYAPGDPVMVLFEGDRLTATVLRATTLHRYLVQTRQAAPRRLSGRPFR